ncbi:type II toxin-antitoxin system PemK/MazF family toxin [Brucella thiophenivorans]|uniref:type II toxin-antitoxin system PemK/MazF family toxin n=1 Tax=Brucella thiophenivorans TaxID=571255 RepID=UPI00146C880B|nr:type II toxin-antitoxin system PemK/MazF family toxin [Brucella thiophenivorans]
MGKYKRGEIYKIYYQNHKGMRLSSEVVVVSPNIYNNESELTVVVPVVLFKSHTNAFEVKLDGYGEGGTARADMPRVMPLKEYDAKLVVKLPEEIIDEILAKAITLFK